MKKKRPIGVSIIAVLMLVNGILTLINGIGFQAGTVVIIFGAVAILLSIGLWFLMPLAWIGTILLQVAALGYALYDWLIVKGPEIDVIGIALAVMIIFYMLSKEVLIAFGRRAPDPEPIGEEIESSE